jgi:hypothetical protein
MPGWRIAAVAVLVWLAAGATTLAGEPRDQVRTGGERVRLAQARSQAPRITIAPTIVAAPESRVRLPIGIEPLDAAPRNSFVRLKGLPPIVSLTDGHAISPGAWAVPLAGLANLHMNMPAGVSGQSELTVSLVAEDGALLAEATATLIVAAGPAAAPVQSAPRAAPVLTPADRQTAERMVARGERDLQDGNVALARQFFLRAAEAGLARGAMLLAGTYDPRELARQRVQGVQPNPALARKWYERARELGAPEAEERLTSLGGG